MILSMVAAAGECNTLGKEGKLLWHLPHDMRHFKNLTLGHPVIMGRKTFETLKEPLPGRKNIIVTRNKDYEARDCIVTHSVESAIEIAKKETKDQKVCIVGGGEIYKLGLAHANKISLTRIHHKFEGGDAFFPELDLSEWELQSEILHSTDKRHPYSFSYLTYIRK